MPRSLIICVLVGLCILAGSMLLSWHDLQTHANAAAAAAAATRPAPDTRVDYQPGKAIGELFNEFIDESSGLAAGRANKNVLWTHNDSGDKPQVFAINHAGADLATVKITGASARDWEDMCSFSIGRKSFLMLADVGDNAVRRRFCTLYVLPEPRLNLAKRGDKLTVPAAMTINFKYEDGAHNCESLAVDASTKTIYLVSKCRPPACKVYAMALPANSPNKPLVAKAVALLMIPTTTAMDISSDGLRAVVGTYGHAYEYVRRADETWAHGFSRPPRKIELPYRSQGESICYGPDGKTLFLTSENLPVPLIRLSPKSPTTRSK